MQTSVHITKTFFFAGLMVLCFTLFQMTGFGDNYSGSSFGNDIKINKDLEKAPEKENADEQYNKGECYYSGDGIIEDKGRAVEWFRKAAEQGHARAQFRLGLCYDLGKGVKENKERAVEWFRKSAAQGYDPAIRYLEDVFSEGENAAITSVHSLTGTWTGTWQKTNGTSVTCTFYMSQKENLIRCVGQVQGWTCWEVFEGKQKVERFVLNGTHVVANTRQASVYKLDILELAILDTGNRLEGKWSDDSGSSGRIVLYRRALALSDDVVIRQALLF